jgi:hypothetical protein
MAPLLSPDPLDEPSRRRESWRRGVPIRLFNGQEWQFVPPRVSTTTEIIGAKTLLGPRWDFGERFAAEAPGLAAIYPDAYQMCIHESSEAADHAAKLEAIVGVAVLILRANYHIFDEDIPTLFHPTDEAIAAAFVRTVATRLIIDPCNAYARVTKRLLAVQRDGEGNVDDN